MTFAEDASAEAVFAAGSMHDLGGKRVEVKPATPKGSGSVGRSGGAGPGRPGAGSGGRAVPAFGGHGGAPAGPPAALFGSPPGAYGAGFGMYAFSPPGEPPVWGCCRGCG